MNIRLTAAAALAATLIASPALARHRSSDDSQPQSMQGTSLTGQPQQQTGTSSQKQRHSKRQHKKRHARKHSRRRNRDDDTLQSQTGLQSPNAQQYRQ